MHFHGAYFANFTAWQCDPKHCLPSASLLWSVVGQDILNSDVGGYFQGQYITSGLFQLWRSEGIVNQIHLKYAATISLIMALLTLLGAYFHIHVAYFSVHFNRKFKSVALHHLAILLGLASISWCGHCIHISIPINKFLDSGVDPAFIPWPQDFMFRECYTLIFKRFGVGPLVDFSIFLPKGLTIIGSLLNPTTGSLFLASVCAHHFYIGVVLILSGGFIVILDSFLYSYMVRTGILGRVQQIPFSARLRLPNHLQLSASLLVSGSISMLFAHHVYAIPVYPYLSSDYSSVFSLFCHHINIASF
jgi:photosystem I P700 chlorophyll a apoprotein A1